MKAFTVPKICESINAEKIKCVFSNLRNLTLADYGNHPNRKIDLLIWEKKRNIYIYIYIYIYVGKS